MFHCWESHHNSPCKCDASIVVWWFQKEEDGILNIPIKISINYISTNKHNVFSCNIFKMAQGKIKSAGNKGKIYVFIN